jgi:hypothetical protein
MVKIIFGIPHLCNKEDADRWAKILSEYLVDDVVKWIAVPEDIRVEMHDDVTIVKRLAELRETVDEIYVYSVKDERKCGME